MERWKLMQAETANTRAPTTNSRPETASLVDQLLAGGRELDDATCRALVDQMSAEQSAMRGVATVNNPVPLLPPTTQSLPAPSTGNVTAQARPPLAQASNCPPQSAGAMVRPTQPSQTTSFSALPPQGQPANTTVPSVGARSSPLYVELQCRSRPG